MSRLTRDGTAEPVSRDQIFRHERGQEDVFFSCSADLVQDWQPYPVDPYSCYVCDHTLHTSSGCRKKRCLGVPWLFGLIYGASGVCIRCMRPYGAAVW